MTRIDPLMHFSKTNKTLISIPNSTLCSNVAIMSVGLRRKYIFPYI